ncbi:peroxiredoxin [Tichowtungia aerotolerans]|uniref:Alkyl hydroperoxide reductase C n=1 Tax=Tichowtungia aerotolerans TaxID=2697043 RepID=A0A6P1M875_9BACT|nr:redoxin domain-containing protein [Tichowtungia aerotolerans]QHI68348.1 redoxin domain-containing protein [Tichowtungia aerotolerans]
MVKVGQEVPEFKMAAYHNNEITELKLSDYKGKWVVVVFYPADFTFVCPTELEEVADLYAEFQAAGAEVISVSTDTAFVHKAWHDASTAIAKVDYPMGADPSGEVSRLFGVYIDTEGVALRGTFIIDPDGVLKTAETHDLGIGRSAAEALRKLNAAKFVYEHGDQVCPANWNPGSDTLTPGLDLVGKI